MNKKNSLLAIITISTLLITMSAFGGIAITQESSNSVLVKHTYQPSNILPSGRAQMKTDTTSMKSSLLSPISDSSDMDVQVTYSEGFDIQPTITNDDAGNLVLGYIGDPNGAGEYGVWFTSSMDQGATWPPETSVGLTVPTPEKPSIDHWGEGHFYATMAPSSSDFDGGAFYLLDFTDVTSLYDSFNAVYWTFNDLGDGYKFFKDVSMACDNGLEDYAWGGASIIGDYAGNEIETPMFTYQADEAGVAWIYTFNIEENDTYYEHGQSTSTDIDPATHLSYSVWNFENDTTGNLDIYFYSFDFGVWEEYEGYPIHPGVGEGIISSGSDLTNIDISAQNGNILLVAETGDEVICYRSNDGLQTVETSVIAGSGASYPRIIHTEDNTAVCLFTRDNNVFTSITNDGGQTWNTPVQINDEDGTVIADEKMTDISPLGAVWTDDRIGDQNIFFDVPGVAVPIIQIDSIAGGFGVSATIINDGTADAENIPWSITLEDGFVLLGGETTGEIPILAAGDSVTISTGLILGFGSSTIKVSVGGAQKQTSGTVLLFFVIGVE